jgi:hypothetical protein
MEINYVRIERPATESWITYILPRPMGWHEAIYYIEADMPGWEVVSGCHLNPDEPD